MRKIIDGTMKFEKPIETMEEAEGAWNALYNNFPAIKKGTLGVLISTTTGGVYFTKDVEENPRLRPFNL